MVDLVEILIILHKNLETLDLETLGGTTIDYTAFGGGAGVSSDGAGTCWFCNGTVGSGGGNGGNTENPNGGSNASTSVGTTGQGFGGGQGSGSGGFNIGGAGMK